MDATRMADHGEDGDREANHRPQHHLWIRVKEGGWFCQLFGSDGWSCRWMCFGGDENRRKGKRAEAFHYRDAGGVAALGFGGGFTE